jgi:hypothetical protein
MAYTELTMFSHSAPDGRYYFGTAYRSNSPAMTRLRPSWLAPNSEPAFQRHSKPHSRRCYRVAPDATAFALREPHYAVLNSAGWETGPAQPHIEWTRTSLARMTPFASRGLYVNFMGQGDESALRDSYRANYDRLVALKNKYDPTNFFRFNQNIKPTV